MFTRKSAVIAAACALFVGGAARAADPVASTADSSKPVYFDAAPADAPKSAVNEALNAIGVGKFLSDSGVKVSSFIEGSYTYNFDTPPGDINAGRVFDFEHDAARMNQLELMIARPIDTAAAQKANKFDWGFGIEMIYGSDGRLIHANGLNGYNHFTHPINQFDLTQAYAEFYLPAAGGWDIKAGKFVTLFGYETINPTTNPLYSHSYSFGFGIPFTQTGVLVTHNLSDKLSVTGGITRGWDQATNDNNGCIDGLGQVAWTINADTKLLVTGSVGPELTHNNSDYRYVINPIVTWAPMNNPWSLAFDTLFAWEEHSNPSNGKTAYWGDVTGYVGYKLNDMITLNGRAEWFRDDGGSRTGISGSFYEFTVGAAIKPWPKDKWLANLMLRPEFRYDLSNKDAFDGGSKKHQETVAIDAIFAL
jgi:hypothetical protein